MKTQELNRLLDIQDIDIELLGVGRKIQRLVLSLGAVKKERAQLKQDFKNAEDDFAEMQSRRKDQENELQDLEEKLTHLNHKITLVRTAKEAELLDAEKLRLENSISVLEEAILSALEKEEHSAGDLENLRKINSTLFATKGEEGRMLKQSHDELIELKFDFEQERIAGLNRLPGDMKYHYEWLFNKFGGGSVLVRVEQGACTGCGSMLLHKTLQEVKSGSMAVKCDHCMRYLWQDA